MKSSKKMNLKKYAKGTKEVELATYTPEGSVGPVEHSATEEGKLISSTGIKMTKKVASGNADEMKRVAEWQRKRGLKADGVWGKDTQAAYEKEKAAKTSSAKNPVKAVTKATTTKATKPSQPIPSTVAAPTTSAGDFSSFFTNPQLPGSPRIGAPNNPMSFDKLTGSDYVVPRKFKPATKGNLAGRKARIEAEDAKRKAEEAETAKSIVKRSGKSLRLS